MQFVDESVPFSLSVTGAIAVVLLSLLNVNGLMGRDWSDFGTICALNEVQNLVVTMTENVFEDSGVELVLLEGQLPTAAATTNFNLPVVAGNAVFVNGANAPFADIVAPNRLCQCKFKRDANGEVELKREDFEKMGIILRRTDGKDIGNRAKINGALVSLLDDQWNQNPTYINEEATVEPVQSLARAETMMGIRHFYPSAQLLSERPSNLPLYVQHLFRRQLKCLERKEGKKVHRHAYTDALNRTIDAIFYTNARNFVFKFESDKFTLSLADVASDGSISDMHLQQIMDGFGVEMRPNVRLRFLFARNHNLF